MGERARAYGTSVLNMKRLLDALAFIALTLTLGTALVAFMLWLHGTTVWEFWYGGAS